MRLQTAPTEFGEHIKLPKYLVQKGVGFPTADRYEGVLQMTSEEKFQVDLEGYLVIKNVLTEDEVAEMNAFIDRESSESLRGHGDRVSSLWGEPFKSLIDHPKILRIYSSY